MDKNRILEKHVIYKNFPFDIFKGTYNDDTDKSVRIHDHDYCEIEIIISGHANHVVSDDVYPLSAGDVLVVSSGIPHAIKGAKELVFYNISFLPHVLLPYMDDLKLLAGFHALFMLDDNQTNQPYKSRFCLSGKDLEHAERICSIMNKEYAKGTAGFRTAISASLTSLVLLLSRCYELDTDMLSSNINQISYVTAFIENNYIYDLDLDTLAEKSKMSVRHFCRIFKSLHGQSPMDYIITLRLNHAASLLKTGSQSISDIAFETGFSDSSYFSQMFKKKFGISPKDYRKCYPLT